MDASSTSSPAVKPVNAVPQSSEPIKASPTPDVLKKAAPKVPEGYKIVKVRKPDGTIMKVLRPIAKDGVRGASATSPPKSVGEPADTSTGPPSEPKPTSENSAQLLKTQVVLPVKQESQKIAAEKSSVAITSEVASKTADKSSGTTASAATTKKAEATPKGTTSPPAYTSKLEAVSKSARIYRRFHRVHKHASRLVEAFDPHSEVGDYEEGDLSMPDDDDNDSGSQSDDSDVSDKENQKHKSASGSGTQGAVTSTAPHATTNRPTPVAKVTKTDVSVHEVPDNKSTSTELTKEELVLEKEVLPINSTKDGKTEELGPRSLTKGATHWAKLIAWALVILFPLAFMGLGIATACLDKKPTNSVADYQKYWIYYPTTMYTVITHATKAAITAWPIVFAAILAQTLKAAATYQVERGIKLMTLEQLISSHSVSGAIKQPFILRTINWLSLGLMGLWALSPLGSQAMQYTTYQTANITTGHGSIFYLNTIQENPGLSDKTEASDIYSDSMDVLYAAVFQQPSQYQPDGSDPWGNALIPVYEYLAPNSSSFSTIKNISPGVPYSSYYGIPLADFSEYDGAYAGTWNFTIHSSYLYLDCPFLHFETLDQINSGLNNLFPGMTYDNLYNTSTGSLSMEMMPPDATNRTGNITFVSTCSAATGPNGEKTYAYAFCDLSQTFVDSDISCLDSNCTVVNITKIPNVPPTIMTDFIDEFLKASDTGLSDYPYIGDTTFSMTELWIRNQSNATEPGAGDYCDLSSLNPQEFTQSLAYLINTFYSTGFTHDYQVGSIAWNSTVTLSDGLTNSSDTIRLTLQAEGVHTYQSDIAPFLFRIDWLFLTLFEFCAVMLLLIGIVGVLLESKTIAPDILGFASNLARQNRYVKLPKVDGTMSGGERARRLKEVRVMMQDVRGGEEVGKIVLGNANESAERLRPGRLYR